MLRGYEEALGKSLIKGMKRESGMMRDEEEKEEEGARWLALKMFGAKEAEKLTFSHEDAFEDLCVFCVFYHHVIEVDDNVQQISAEKRRAS